MTATIWHNPRCSKSRATLALLEAAGGAVTIVDYVETRPTLAQIARMIAAAGVTPRAALRPDARAPLASADDATILAAMAADRR